MGIHFRRKEGDVFGARTFLYGRGPVLPGGVHGTDGLGEWRKVPALSGFLPAAALACPAVPPARAAVFPLFRVSGISVWLHACFLTSTLSSAPWPKSSSASG